MTFGKNGKEDFVQGELLRWGSVIGERDWARLWVKKKKKGNL